MATLLAAAYPALSEVDPREAEFLSHLVGDAVATAAREGNAQLRFHEFEVSAWSSSLGALLVAVTWSVTRHGVPVARDTAIRYARRNLC